MLFVFSCLIKFCSMQICLCWKMLLATVLKSQNRKNLSSLRKRKVFSILKPFKLFKEHVTEEIGADYSDYHIIFQDIEKILQLMILPMIQSYGKYLGWFHIMSQISWSQTGIHNLKCVCSLLSRDITGAYLGF